MTFPTRRKIPPPLFPFVNFVEDFLLLKVKFIEWFPPVKILGVFLVQKTGRGGTFAHWFLTKKKESFCGGLPDVKNVFFRAAIWIKFVTTVKTNIWMKENHAIKNKTKKKRYFFQSLCWIDCWLRLTSKRLPRSLLKEKAHAKKKNICEKKETYGRKHQTFANKQGKCFFGQSFFFPPRGEIFKSSTNHGNCILIKYFVYFSGKTLLEKKIAPRLRCFSQFNRVCSLFCHF